MRELMQRRSTFADSVCSYYGYINLQERSLPPQGHACRRESSCKVLGK